MPGSSPPPHITLATDLSARSDRAYDRAHQLAGDWQARLLVVHAVEPQSYEFWTTGPSWRRPPDMVDVAHRKLRSEYPGWQALGAEVVVARADPYELVLQSAERAGTDLIVTGVARDEPYGSTALGRLVVELVRHANAPVLAVKRRVTGPYRQIVVATDLSVSSAQALKFVLQHFPGRPITLFHAFDIAYSGMVEDIAAAERAGRSSAAGECHAWLKEQVGEEALKSIGIVAEYGSPAKLLAEYVADKDVDLVVAGSHGRSGMMEALIGSVATAVLEEVPCDVLVVRARRAT